MMRAAVYRICVAGAAGILAHSQRRRHDTRLFVSFIMICFTAMQLRNCMHTCMHAACIPASNSDHSVTLWPSDTMTAEQKSVSPPGDESVNDTCLVAIGKLRWFIA